MHLHSIACFLQIYFYIEYLRSVNWVLPGTSKEMYEGWNFNSGNYLFTTDTK